MCVKRKHILETPYPVTFYCILSVLNLQCDRECSAETVSLHNAMNLPDVKFLFVLGLDPI